MSSKIKYEPEDIEYILLNKEYNDLDAEQRKFVDEFVHSEEEYLLMRRTLLSISNTAEAQIEIVPPYAIKDRLMAEFDKEDSMSIAAWWKNISGFLFPVGRPLFSKPGFQMSLVACSVILIVVLIPWGDLNQQHENVAYQEVKETEPDPSQLDNKANASGTLSEKGEGTALDEDEKGNVIVADLEQEFNEAPEMKEDIGRLTTVAETVVLDSIESGLAGGYSGDVANTPIKDGWSREDVEDKYADDGDIVSPSKSSELNKSFVSEEMVVEAEKRDLDDVKNSATDLDNAVSNGVFNSKDISSSEIESNEDVLLESISVNAAGASRSNQKKRFQEKAETDLPRLSRSLGDEQELIDLLFTAM